MRGYAIVDVPVTLGNRFGLTLILEFIESGLVPRLPSAVLEVGLAPAGMHRRGKTR
jgi:hypothetical protein